MNTYEVTMRVSGYCTIEVQAKNEAEAKDEAEGRWDRTDIDDLDVESATVECVGRPEDVKELGDGDDELVIAEVVTTTMRQFQSLMAAGITRSLYAVPDDVEDRETVDHLVSTGLRGQAHFTRKGSHTYLEAVSS